MSFDKLLFEKDLIEGSKLLKLEHTELQIQQMVDFSSEFFKWNAVHNLSSINSYAEYLGAHVMDSLAVVRPLLEKANQGMLPREPKVADLGVGGGFPGMLLAICLPHFDFYLVEAVKKKTAFLQHIKGRLRLNNVHVIDQRIEAFSKIAPNSMDATISRAFTELKNFVVYSKPLLKPRGVMFAMKSQKIKQEIESLAGDSQIIDSEELKIPYLDAYRCILTLQSMRKS
jgi:16S rRNA (guanine527-N7)-methyltransferase